LITGGYFSLSTEWVTSLVDELLAAFGVEDPIYTSSPVESIFCGFTTTPSPMANNTHEQ
jgi:hypothetical protein